MGDLADEIREIWQAAGQHDLPALEQILWEAGMIEAGEALADFIVVGFPDDIKDERYRAWIKTRPESEQNPARVKSRLLSMDPRWS